MSLGPIEIEVIDATAKKIVSFECGEKTSTFKIKVDKKPLTLFADPRITLLAKIEVKEQ